MNFISIEFVVVVFYCCVSVMVYEWPLSPSSCEIAIVVVVETN
jgi:hypothetical protein